MRENANHKHVGTDGWATRYLLPSPNREQYDWVSARWPASQSGNDYFVMELVYRPGYWVVRNWASNRLELHGPFMDLHVAKTTLILLTGEGP